MSGKLRNSLPEIEEEPDTPTTKRSISNAGTINNELKLATSDLPVTGYESLSNGDKVLVVVTFLTNGIAALLAWNAVVNSFVALQKVIWPGSNFSGMMGGFEYGAATLTVIILYFFNSLNVTLIYISGVINMLVTTLFPTICYYYAGKEHEEKGKWLLILVSVLAGVGSGIFNIVGFSFAAIMPFKNALPLVSSGHGAAGAVTFGPYLLLSGLVFSKSVEGQQALLFTFFAYGTFITMIHIVCFTLLNRRPWFKAIVQKAILSKEEAAEFRSMRTTKTAIGQEQPNSKDQSQDLVQASKEPPPSVYSVDYKVQRATDITTTDTHKIPSNINIEDVDCEKASTGPPRHVLEILKDSGLPIFCGSLTVFFSMFVYPTTGPYNWGASYITTTLCAGTYQVTNTIMRYAPTWEFLHLRREWLLPAVLARVIFTPIFLTPARFAPDNAVLTHPVFLVFLMLVFTLSHAWLLTLSTIYTASCLPNPKEKAIASKIMVIGYLGAMTIALLSSKLLLLGQAKK